MAMKVIQPAICGHCGKEFIPKRRTAGQFCSQACVSPGRSQLDEARIIELYQSGVGIKTIATQLIGRVSAKNTVRGALIRNGIALRSTATTQDEATKQRRYARAVEAKAKRDAMARAKPKKKQRRAFNELPLFGYGSEVVAAKRQEERLDGIRQAGYRSEYHLRYATDPKFRAKEIVKRRFQKLVKCIGHGSTRMMRLIGCTQDELRQWIESQWEEWMTWDNLGPQREGYWQIDHIVPCSWFDQEKQEDLDVCWHYLNLRPLCAKKNGARSNRPDFLIETVSKLPDHPMKAKLMQFAILNHKYYD